METAYQFLADYAADQGGKIYAVGAGFDTIMASSVPVRHEQMTLVCGLRYSAMEFGERHLEAHLIDADGKDVVPPFRGAAMLPRVGDGTGGSHRLLFRWINVELPRFGAYAAILTLDGAEVANVPFRLAQRPEQSR